MDDQNISFGTLFTHLDTNKDNKISKEEFRKEVKTKVKQLNETQIDEVFKLLDSNKDGKLSHKELIKYDEYTLEELMRMFPKTESTTVQTPREGARNQGLSRQRVLGRQLREPAPVKDGIDPEEKLIAALKKCQCSETTERNAGLEHGYHTDAKLKPNECYVSDPGDKPEDVEERCSGLENTVYKIKHGERGLGFIESVAKFVLKKDSPFGGRWYRQCNEEYDRQNIEERGLVYNEICKPEGQAAKNATETLMPMQEGGKKKKTRKNKRSKVRSQKKRKGKK